MKKSQCFYANHGVIIGRGWEMEDFVIMSSFCNIALVKILSREYLGIFDVKIQSGNDQFIQIVKTFLLFMALRSNLCVDIY